MAAQRGANFQWLIYLDEQTPDVFKARLERARAIVPFEPIFVGPFRAGLAAIDVRKRLATEEGRLLTTRLDNDDAVSSDFLTLAQSHAERFPDGTIINFRDGIALQDGALFAASDTSNPFTSLVESAKDAETIWAAPHTELAQRFPLRQVICEPCWLQVVHGENVANRVKGRRLADDAVLARFELPENVLIEKTGSLALFADRLVLYPLRQLRELAVRLAKTVLRRH